MESDKFVRNSIHPFIKQTADDSNNFFLHLDDFNINQHQTEPLRHINDYDSNILKDGAYKVIKDDTIKLEYKISRIEDELKTVENQIKSAEDIYDYYTVNSLKNRKQLLEQELENLVFKYQQLSLSAKISNGLASGIKNKYKSFLNSIINFTGMIFSKMPGKLSSFIEMRNSLVKLENINKSVDELMARQYPYGESIEKYNQLTKYIARANSIQADISKLMK